MRKKYIIARHLAEFGEPEKTDYNKEDGFSWGYRYKGVYTDLGKAKEQLEKISHDFIKVEWLSGIVFYDKLTETEVGIYEV